MPVEVTMPQMGESVVEGTIAKWLVKEGDTVVEDQRLLEISTEKVDTEIPPPGAGQIAKIVTAEGQTVPVGATLAVIETVGAETAAKLKVVAPKSVPKPEPVQATAQVQASSASESSVHDGRHEHDGQHEVESGAGGSRRFSPVVLKMAAEEGIDLSLVPGTRIGGRLR